MRKILLPFFTLGFAVLLFSCKKYDDVQKKSDYETSQGKISVNIDGFTGDSIYIKTSMNATKYENLNVDDHNGYTTDDSLIHVNVLRYIEDYNGSKASFQFAFNSQTREVYNMIRSNFYYFNYQNGNEFLNYSHGFAGFPNDSNKIENITFDANSGRLTGTYTFKSGKAYGPPSKRTYTYMTISGDFDVTLNQILK